MTQKWTGSNTASDVKSAHKTGIIFKSWDSWEMYGLGGRDILTGGEASDRIYGGEDADDLSGLGGNDYLDGGESADKMYGGLGNDTFVVDHSSDEVIERLGEGSFDEIHSYAYSYTMPQHVENLRLMDDANGAGRSVTGNSENNTIYGNKWGNRIFGMNGHDTLYGNGGDDYIEGGEGNDTLASDPASTKSKLYGQGGNDRLWGGGELHGGIGDDTYMVTTDSKASIIENSGEGIDVILVMPRFSQSGQVIDEVYRMPESVKSIERVELTSFSKHVEGNSSDNRLVANVNVGSILFGMGGRDNLLGQGKDDSIIGGEGSDTMNGGGGGDFISGYGGSEAGIGDRMTGGTGKDVFSLGDFYLDEGFVRITDFSSREGDKVQIKGSISDYVLRIDYQETRLLHKSSGDLVAIFEGTNRPALNTDFQYIS